MNILAFMTSSDWIRSGWTRHEQAFFTLELLSRAHYAYARETPIPYSTTRYHTRPGFLCMRIAGLYIPFATGSEPQGENKYERLNDRVVLDPVPLVRAIIPCAARRLAPTLLRGYV
jgi:hypothetical protein